MRIKLFAVGAQKERTSLTLRTRVAAAFRPFSQEVLVFSDHPSFEEMAPSLDAALRSCELVAVFAALPSYAKTKELLLRSLHLRTELRFDLFECAAPELGDIAMSSPEAAVHIELPLGATVFPTQTGLYPGFCVHAKKQDILFLPYDEELTPAMLKAGLTDYLHDLSFAERYRSGRIPFLHDDICNILAEAGLQVAVAATPASRFLFTAGKRLDGFSRYFLPYENVEPRGDSPLDRHTVKLAIDASRALDCPYGVALSNIACVGGDTRRIHYAVAGKKNFAASCLTAEFAADETGKIEDFFAEGLNSLFALLKKRLYEENAILRRNR